MSRGLRGAVVIAVFVAVTALTGCTGDGERGAGTPPPSTSAVAPEPTPTPTVEAASGITLEHNHAEITVPVGWEETDNFGALFIRQANDTTDGHGILTFSELGGADAEATSLDAIAERQLRLVDTPGIVRLDDVAIGDGTRAYHLAGVTETVTPVGTVQSYEAYYGILISESEGYSFTGIDVEDGYQIEYTLAFDFTLVGTTVEEATATIESILATWDFNPR